MQTDLFRMNLVVRQVSPDLRKKNKISQMIMDMVPMLIKQDRRP